MSEGHRALPYGVEIESNSHLRAERSAAALADLAHGLVRACRVIDGALSTSGLWMIGDPPRTPRVTLDEDALGAFLREVADARGRGIPAVCALTPVGTPGPATALVADIAPDPGGGIGHLWLRLPAGLQSVGGASRLVREVAEAFGAHNAHVEDLTLLTRYRSRRAAERARAATPPELRRYLPAPPDLTDGVDLGLSLLAPEFDRRRVPEAIWWINYWGAAQVEALGEERVRAAGWAQVLDAAGGALVLVATDEPTDPHDRRHLERLRLLFDNVGLREAQEKACYR